MKTFPVAPTPAPASAPVAPAAPEAQYDPTSHSILVRIPLLPVPAPSSTGKMRLWASFSAQCPGPKGRVVRIFGNVGERA